MLDGAKKFFTGFSLTVYTYMRLIIKMQISGINTYSMSNRVHSYQNTNFGQKAPKIAVYAGSFDPITNGHIDMIKEGSRLFDKLIVLIAKNSKKAGFLPIEKRQELIKESVKNIKNVEVNNYEGLTVDYAKKNGAKYLLRGMRSVKDFDDEMQISKTNEALNPKIKSVFLFATSKNSGVSSSVVRELLANHCDIRKFVPKPVYEYFQSILK